MSAEKRSSPAAPRKALVAMVAIVVTLAFVAIYAGVQRLRRDKIEQAVVIPAASVTPSPP